MGPEVRQFRYWNITIPAVICEDGTEDKKHAVIVVSVFARTAADALQILSESWRYHPDMGDD